MLICFYFLYYNDERDEGQTLWFALVWKILSKRGWQKEGVLVQCHLVSALIQP